MCQKLTGLDPTQLSCFSYSIKTCEGACIQKEIPESYNRKVRQLIDKNSYQNQNMVIIDRGRDIDERSAILIENGVFKGLGFFNLNYQIQNIEVLQSFITAMEHNRDTQHIIQNYMRRNKKIKILKLASI